MTEAEADELNVVLNLSGLFKRAGIAPHADFCCPGSYRRSAFAARVAGPPHVVQVIERGLRRFGADPHAQGRRTVTNPSTYLGLDVHKETIAVAIADGRSSDVRFYGGINNTPVAIAGMLKRLGGRYGKLRVVYEAGPCGYGIYRQVNAAGHVCEVVSPAHTPRRAGDRVKTDRRDAILLARLARAGELTPVWVPDETHEAMRDLIRGRAVAVKDIRQARQRIRSFLLRYDRRYAGAVWNRSHRTWLGNQSFGHPAQQITFQSYLNAMDQAIDRRDSLDRQIAELVCR
jgi:transposase